MNIQDILCREFYNYHIFYLEDKHNIIVTTYGLSRICGVDVEELIRFSKTVNTTGWPDDKPPFDDESLWFSEQATSAIFHYNLPIFMKSACDFGVIGYLSGLIGIRFKLVHSEADFANRIIRIQAIYD